MASVCMLCRVWRCSHSYHRELPGVELPSPPNVAWARSVMLPAGSLAWMPLATAKRRRLAVTHGWLQRCFGARVRQLPNTSHLRLSGPKDPPSPRAAACVLVGPQGVGKMHDTGRGQVEEVVEAGWKMWEEVLGVAGTALTDDVSTTDPLSASSFSRQSATQLADESVLNSNCRTNKSVGSPPDCERKVPFPEVGGLPPAMQTNASIPASMLSKTGCRAAASVSRWLSSPQPSTTCSTEPSSHSNLRRLQSESRHKV